MVKTRKSLNLKKKNFAYFSYLSSLIRFRNDHKKTCVAAKVLGNLHFLLFFGFPINFDKEKWYYMYIEKFLKNDVFLMFCHNFVTSISNLVICGIMEYNIVNN